MGGGGRATGWMSAVVGGVVIGGGLAGGIVGAGVPEAEVFIGEYEFAIVDEQYDLDVLITDGGFELTAGPEGLSVSGSVTIENDVVSTNLGRNCWDVFEFDLDGVGVVVDPRELEGLLGDGVVTGDPTAWVQLQYGALVSASFERAGQGCIDDFADQDGRIATYQDERAIFVVLAVVDGEIVGSTFDGVVPVVTPAIGASAGGDPASPGSSEGADAGQGESDAVESDAVEDGQGGDDSAVAGQDGAGGDGGDVSSGEADGSAAGSDDGGSDVADGGGDDDSAVPWVPIGVGVGAAAAAGAGVAWQRGRRPRPSSGPSESSRPEPDGDDDERRERQVTVEITYPVGPSPRVFVDGWVFGARAVVDPGGPAQRDVSDLVRWSGTAKFRPAVGATTRPRFEGEGPNTLTATVEVDGVVATATAAVQAVAVTGYARISDIAFVAADAHGCPACPHPARGPIVNGSPLVTVGDLPAARVGDVGIHAACCNGNTYRIASGDPTVLIDGRPAARVGDVTDHCGGTGSIETGHP